LQTHANGHFRTTLSCRQGPLLEFVGVEVFAYVVIGCTESEGGGGEVAIKRRGIAARPCASAHVRPAKRGGVPVCACAYATNSTSTASTARVAIWTRSPATEMYQIPNRCGILCPPLEWSDIRRMPSEVYQGVVVLVSALACLVLALLPPDPTSV
jgi:hypothetical protein